MNYVLVLILPAVFFGMVGLMVHQIHAMERARARVAVVKSSYVSGD